MRLLLAAVSVAIVLVSHVAAQRAGAGSQTTCDTTQACFPWSPLGPACSRGNKINMRFQLQLAPENEIEQAGRPEPISNVTYAFCPRVDELQAFNITQAGNLGFVYDLGNNADGTPNWVFTNASDRHLSVIGLGDTRDINFPQIGSAGKAKIGEWGADIAGGSGLDSDCVDRFAIVEFIVLNISLHNGKLRYYEGHPQPAGTGFVPSCDDFDVCVYDSTLKCVGYPGQKQCARCVTAAEAVGLAVQVWVSYYGTDAGGRTLRSGANNPLNFQAFSGTGVSGAMRRSFKNIEEGRTIDGDDLEPGSDASKRWFSALRRAMNLE